MRKGVGSVSERYGSGDPDPHQNVTDPQHCLNFSPCNLFEWTSIDLLSLGGFGQEIYLRVEYLKV
jgi:hypothetical protein